MEVQDLPAIVAAAHERNVRVVLDNTWSAGVLLDAFAHGVDVTMQAITKYIGGHSDLLLGSITVRDDALYQRLGAAQQVIGCAVSPDDCSLALRGLQTLGGATLGDRIFRSLHRPMAVLARQKWNLCFIPRCRLAPATNSGNAIFLGPRACFRSCSSRVQRSSRFMPSWMRLKLFRVGYSWGGVASLAVAYDIGRIPGRPPYEHRIVRLNIGLEATDDLIADLEQGLGDKLTGVECFTSAFL